MVIGLSGTLTIFGVPVKAGWGSVSIASEDKLDSAGVKPRQCPQNRRRHNYRGHRERGVGEARCPARTLSCLCALCGSMSGLGSAPGGGRELDLGKDSGRGCAKGIARGITKASTKVSTKAIGRGFTKGSARGITRGLAKGSAKDSGKGLARGSNKAIARSSLKH